MGPRTQRVVRGAIVVGTDATLLIASLLPWRAGVAVGATLGTLAWLILSKPRTLALQNLAQAFPETSVPELRRIGRESFANLGRSLMELFMCNRGTRAQLSQRCRFNDEARLNEARASGRGVIFFTGHTGNWELLAASIAQRGYPVRVVATAVYDRRLDERLVAIRKRQGVETIRRGSSAAARQLLSALRDNALLGMLIDQDTDVDGAFVPFFGRPAYTPVGAAALALKTGASVVCGFIVREHHTQHRIIVEGPLELAKTGNTRADIEVNTARFTERIEQHIRRHPEQWIWFHRRWKRQPAQPHGEGSGGASGTATVAVDPLLSGSNPT